MFSGRPNATLTEDERHAKKELKHSLRRQSRLHKFHVQHATALARGEHALANQAAAHYELLWQHEQDYRIRRNTKNGNSSTNGEEQVVVVAHNTQNTSLAYNSTLSTAHNSCRSFVERVYHGLQTRLNQTEPLEQASSSSNNNNSNRSTKESRNSAARELLAHMAKATLLPSMLDEPDAVRGYTRHKFQERAMLVVRTLLSLQPEQDEHEEWSIENDDDDDDDTTRLWWERLTCVTTIASVGCGPGCDAVGAMAVLLQQQLQQQPTNIRLVLLDWAMPQWSFLLRPLVEELTKITVEWNNNLSNQEVEEEKGESLEPAMNIEVHMATCDIRAGLFADENAQTRLLLMPHENRGTASSSSTPDQSFSTLKASKVLTCTITTATDIDLYLISYLLSETHGRWQVLLDDLMRCSRPGTFFWLADPTAWQLNVFIKRYNSKHNSLTWIWLDSSRHRPDLQQLEGRVGPAVLLAMKL
jgi:hypothetical protein